MDKNIFLLNIILMLELCLGVNGGIDSGELVGFEIKQLVEQELRILAEAEERVYLDTGYFVSIENLDDLPSETANYWFDYINAGGGAAVIDPRTGRFKPERVDLLQYPHLWLGPYVTFQPGRISEDGAGYDPGTLLDLWGRPYYLFTPVGLARPPEMSITQEFYGDQFDRYAIVSLGPDGEKSSDDIIRWFGFPPSALVISSLRPNMVEPGEEVTVRGYNFGTMKADEPKREHNEEQSLGEELKGEKIERQVLLNNNPVAEILLWSDREIRFKVPLGAQSGYVKVKIGAVESNGLYLTVVSSVPAGSKNWWLYM